MIEGMKMGGTLVESQKGSVSTVTLVDNVPLMGSRDLETAVVANIVPVSSDVSKEHARQFHRKCQVELWRQFKLSDFDFDTYLRAIVQDQPGVSLRPSRVASF